MKRLKKRDKAKSAAHKKAVKKKPVKAVKKPAVRRVHKQIRKQVKNKPVKALRRPAKKPAVIPRHAKKKNARHLHMKAAVPAKQASGFLKRLSLLFSNLKQEKPAKEPQKAEKPEKTKKIPENKKGGIPGKKEWKIKPLIDRHLLGPKIATAVFVFFITLVIILHKKGRFSIAEPAYAAALAFVFVIFTAYSIMGFYRTMKLKTTGAAFMIDGYKPCAICKPCIETEHIWAVPGAFVEFMGSRASTRFHSLTCRLAKRISKKNLISFRIKTKDIRIKKPHASSNRIAMALFVLAVTAMLILHRKGIFNITEPASATALALVFTLFIVYILKGALMATKSSKKQPGLKKAEALKKMQGHDIARAGKYETDIDRLLRLVNNAGRVSAGDAARIFGIKKEDAEEWGRILESHGLIEIEYPAMGEVQLCKKSLKPTG